MQNTTQLIADIQTKLFSSEALNGGFDTLMFKIDSVEKAQSVIVDKVNLIHDALYKPDNGLFARVKQTEQGAEEAHAHSEVVRNLDVSVKDLTRWQQFVNRGAKWLAVAIGGSLITLIGKLLLAVISGHVKFV